MKINIFLFILIFTACTSCQSESDYLLGPWQQKLDRKDTESLEYIPPIIVGPVLTFHEDGVVNADTIKGTYIIKSSILEDKKRLTLQFKGKYTYYFFTAEEDRLTLYETTKDFSEECNDGCVKVYSRPWFFYSLNRFKLISRFTGTPFSIDSNNSLAI
jgi:hypothetical protein